jgi:hypothetical protein
MKPNAEAQLPSPDAAGSAARSANSPAPRRTPAANEPAEQVLQPESTTDLKKVGSGEWGSRKMRRTFAVLAKESNRANNEPGNPSRTVEQDSRNILRIGYVGMRRE